MNSLAKFQREHTGDSLIQSARSVLQRCVALAIVSVAGFAVWAFAGRWSRALAVISAFACRERAVFLADY
jgi:hypothetical protein